MKIEAVIFDFDGVLLASQDLHFESFAQSLERVTGFVLDKTYHDEKLNGLPTKEKIQVLGKDNPYILREEQKILILKQQLTILMLEERNLFRPEIISMMDRLRSVGIKLAVCSNTVRATLDLALTKMKVLERIDLSLSSNDVFQAKPSPEIYLKAMKLMEVKPDSTLILEDSVPGLEAARKSGGKVLEVRDSRQVCFELISPLLV